MGRQRETDTHTETERRATKLLKSVRSLSFGSSKRRSKFSMRVSSTSSSSSSATRAVGKACSTNNRTSSSRATAHSSKRCSPGLKQQRDRKTAERKAESTKLNRRDLFLASTLGVVTLDYALDADRSEAIQGLTAGRVPGLSAVDSEGFRRYTRPEGKSGGHGIGWSEIPQYSFRVPDGWKEEAVSIADLGGTEIDVRFVNQEEGQLAVVVAPVLRFMNVGFNADVRIEDIGPPEKILNGFAPEILGGPVDEDDIVNQETMSKGPLTYYIWETKSHDLLTATAFKNRVFIIALRASGRQWRTAKNELHVIQKSFAVETA